MKKAIAWLLLLAMALMLAACSSQDPQATATPQPLATDAPLLPGSSVLSAESADDELGEWQEPVGDNEGEDFLGAEGEDLLGGEGEDLPGEDLSGLLEGDEDQFGLESPTPTPLATPAKTVKIKDYVLTEYSDDAMRLTMQYPSHWTVEPGANTVSFTEPVEAGKTAMRIAVTAKTYDADKLTAKQQTKEFNSFLKIIKGSYTKFKAAKVSNKLVFMNRGSLSCYYNAKLNGVKMRGFVIMANNARDKQIIALHFYAPLSKFKSSGSFFKKILYSVSPMGVASATPTPTPA